MSLHRDQIVHRTTPLFVKNGTPKTRRRRAKRVHPQAELPPGKLLKGIFEGSTFRRFHRLTRRTSSGRVMLRRAAGAGPHEAHRTRCACGNPTFGDDARAKLRGNSRAVR